MNSNCVLLADSHQDMLEGIRGLLKTTFNSVVMVADEKSLFDTVEKLQPDIVVVDLSLPVSDEVNVARKIKSLYPDLKFIILSVHDEATTVSEIMSAGTAGFVLKRCIATDLLSAVQEISQGKRYISPSLKV
jgi:DNA-binding NarL/FixJ family response regulator